jgi:rhodanese-related sulfurtransferase
MKATPHQTAAIDYFSRRLEFETDPADVRADLEAGERFAFVDVRGDAAWDQGRAAGAEHLPYRAVAEGAAAHIPLDMPVVVYCWGPGCNAGVRGALEFAKLGYSVKEMIGGFEYWAREGNPIETDAGPLPRKLDPLTAPRGL